MCAELLEQTIMFVYYSTFELIFTNERQKLQKGFNGSALLSFRRRVAHILGGGGGAAWSCSRETDYA